MFAMKFMTIARPIAVLMLGIFTLLTVTGQSRFYGSVRPGAWVVIHKHPMGSDLVTITIQGNNYPQSAINDKMARLGRALGNEPRNVVATIDGPVVKINFAVVGLITDVNPRVNIAALAVALAFGEHPIKTFSVFFADMAPDTSTPNRWFPVNNAWRMEGVSMTSPKGLDYRVQVTTNDPNEIYMPDSKTKEKLSGKPISTDRPNIFILGGIVLGAIAVGLLVYSALLRPRSKGR